MPFEDLFPRETLTERHQQIERSSSDVLRDAVASRINIVGRKAIYRVAMRAMPIPGFPDELRVGGVRVSQGDGPLRTQQTTIAQVPGLRPTYIKSMEQAQVADGETLTLAQLDVRVPEDLSSAMERWHATTTAALGLITAVLDERIAQEQVAEDVLVFDAAEAEVEAAVDHVPRVRLFQSANRMLSDHLDALKHLHDAEIDSDNQLVAGARWYLRAAQQGPTADAVVFLWIGLEALSKPSYGSKLSSADRARSDVAWVERAVESAGLETGAIDPSIGRLAGVRAEIVHGGVERPALLSSAYYTLEAITRALLRARIDMAGVGWPLHPDASNLRHPFDLLARYFHERPRTIWR